MLDLAGGARVSSREVRLQEVLQARLKKTAKTIIDKAKEEEETVLAIRKDVGYDILEEAMLK